MGNFPSFKRESRIYNGMEFQLMMGSEDWYKNVIQDYEKDGNIGTITVMLAQGHFVWGKT